MSWTTGTQTEALSANQAVGSAFSNFTAPTYIGPDPSASAYLPANFFLPAYGKSKSLLVKAHGVLSDTGTPTLQVGMSGNTTQGTYNGAAIFAVNAALTLPSGVSNVPWELDLTITCSGTGSSGAFLADGAIKVYGTTTSLSVARVSSSAANPNTAVTISTESAYYLELFAAWSAASASNAIQCYSIDVLGVN